MSWYTALEVTVKLFSTTSLTALTFSCLFDMFEPKRTKFPPLAVLTVFSASAKNFCWSMRVEMCLFKSLFLLHSLKTKRALLSATLIGLLWNRPAALDPAINAKLSRRCGASSVCPLSSSFFRKPQCEKHGDSNEFKVIVCSAFLFLQEKIHTILDWLS